MRVYTRNLVSNGLPPFLEPVIFLVGIGLGLGRYIDAMDGLPYLVFLATALPRHLGHVHGLLRVLFR